MLGKSYRYEMRSADFLTTILNTLMTLKILKSITNFVAFVREVVYNFKGIFSNTKGGRIKCPYSVSIDSNQTHMKLTPIAANQNEVEFTNGTQVFFSYKTPVAAYCPSKGYIRTAKFWSVTTSRHINKWLKGITEVTEVPQEMLTELAG